MAILLNRLWTIFVALTFFSLISVFIIGIGFLLLLNINVEFLKIIFHLIKTPEIVVLSS